LDKSKFHIILKTMKMKNLFLSILLNFLVFGFLYSQDNSKITVSNLNLRQTPDNSSEVITVIPKGTVVKIKKNCDCDWIPILYDGKVGYVSSKYLRKTTYKSESVGVGTTKVKHYTNSNGKRVQSPTYYNSPPAGATALCRDGTYSFSRNRRGTCSHHGGVERWL
jgi:uncharacterized protein YgiM (DUF1202 family)